MEERNSALEESQQRQREATTRSTFNANPVGPRPGGGRVMFGDGAGGMFEAMDAMEDGEW